MFNGTLTEEVREEAEVHLGKREMKLSYMAFPSLVELETI